jgi:hypothetical protein
MGLDMYLTAQKYIGGWRHAPDGERNEFERLVELFGMEKFVTDASPGAYVEFTVGYWRKANHIHSWFVRECQDGVDECQKTVVDIDQLKELRDVCLRVMASTKLIPGTVHTGTVYSKAHPSGAVMMEPGQIMEDPTVAHELLEPEEGFFFGSQDYDEGYWEDLRRTVEVIDRCIHLSQREGEYWDFQYRSSW